MRKGPWDEQLPAPFYCCSSHCCQLTFIMATGWYSVGIPEDISRLLLKIWVFSEKSLSRAQMWPTIPFQASSLLLKGKQRLGCVLSWEKGGGWFPTRLSTAWTHFLRNCLGNIVAFIFKWNFFREEIHNSSAFLKATLGQHTCAINLVAKSESEIWLWVSLYLALCKQRLHLYTSKVVRVVNMGYSTKGITSPSSFSPPTWTHGKELGNMFIISAIIYQTLLSKENSHCCWWHFKNTGSVLLVINFFCPRS